MLLRQLTFKAEARYYYEEQGKDYPVQVQVTAILHNDGETLIVTDITPCESSD